MISMVLLLKGEVQAPEVTFRMYQVGVVITPGE